MPRSSHLSIFLLISLALHLLVAAAVLFLAGPAEPGTSETPVKIVDLPPDVLKRLPPLGRRTTQGPRSGTGEEVRLPTTAPLPPEREDGKPGEKGAPQPAKEQGPLPFLTQREIDELARKGMPPRRPGEESVTLDTDEFKFMAYTRWLDYKLNRNLRYPELAAVSGLQGLVYVRFDILKDGSLDNLRLVKSSGYKILDDEVLRAIRDSAPFQPLPEAWEMDRLPLVGTGIFYINRAYIR